MIPHPRLCRWRHVRKNLNAYSIHAPAKLNLFLQVTGRRDNYHLIESLVVFTKFGDRLEVSDGPDISLEVAGPFASGCGPVENNLVLLAARALAAQAPAPAGAALKLHKLLPPASGLGGGSSDAAAAIQLLLSFWKLRIRRKTLSELALSLGADVPVCLQRKPTLVAGIGERLSAAPVLPPCYVLLVNPRIPLMAKTVFERLNGRFSGPVTLPRRFANVRNLARHLNESKNDLQPPACELAPEILTVLSALQQRQGCLLARMSGSGATCFGLFEDVMDMAAAANAIARSHPGYWLAQTRF